MRLIIISLLLSVFPGCKETPRAESRIGGTHTETPSKAYPEALGKVFKAHGGLASWKNKRTLTFEISQGEGTETHTIDLYSRMDKITGPGYTMGYDGSQVWLADQEAFDGDPVFYHNLMFYFFAMPFVFGDDGIHYGVAEEMEFLGKKYPGVSIGYGDGIGVSPKDEYYLYYDPVTYRMAWLGYTVTYATGTPSDDIHWIRYNDWQRVHGLLVPVSVTWHAYKGQKILKERNTVVFQKVTMSESAEPASFYSMPAGARPVPKKSEY